MAEDENKDGGQKKSKRVTIIIIVSLVLILVTGAWLYGSRNVEKEPVKPDGLLLGEHVKFLEEKSRIADFIVFEYMIRLEKLQRTVNLDVELAGRRAECYGENRIVAQNAEKERVQTEIKRLKGALEQSRKEASKIREKLSYAKKEHMMKKDNQK